MSDLVSIVIPCYNPGSYLVEAIQSAREQTHPDIEIVIVNDGTDLPESRHLLEQVARLVDVCIEQTNRGLPSARNAGFRAAHGDFLVPLDADDRLDPQYVSHCLAALRNSPGSAFAYSDYTVFGTKNYVEHCGGYNLYRLLDQNFLTYAALLPRDTWERSSGYDESMRLGYEDWEFWLRLGAQGCFGVHVPLPLFRYRKHGPSLYDVALSRHSDLIAYIHSRHPELYELESRVRIKTRWAPAVCIVDPVIPTPTSQTVQDLEILQANDAEPLVDQSSAPVFLLPGEHPIDTHSAELAALACWSGHTRLRLPDGSVAVSRDAFGKKRAREVQAADDPPASRLSLPIPRRLFKLRRHLANADLLSAEAWLKHPLRSTMRLIPLRMKERINRAAGRPVFDLSFYLQFQPDSVLMGGVVEQPLRYYPASSRGRFRVVLITPHLGSGGAEGVMLEIASALRSEGFEILLLATQSRDDRWLNRWQEQIQHIYDLAKVVSPERMSMAVSSIISNWKCEALMVQNSLFGYAALPQIKRELPGIRTMDLIHALDDRWDQVSATSEVAAGLDLHAAANQGVVDRLRVAGIPTDKIKLVRTGIDLEVFRASPVRPQAALRRILFAGRLDPVKRSSLLVDIAIHLAKLRKPVDFQIVVAGEGEEAVVLRERVRKAGLRDLFDFQGHVDHIAPLFADCDVCVVPSRAEGVPLVVLEALASARPVVASNVGSIHEVLDSTCGALIEVGPDEAGAFASTLCLMLDQPDLRQRMGDAGRSRIEAEYDRRHAKEAYLRLFRPSA